MAAVHYYLGRPARVWISAHSPRSPARQAREGSGRVHSSIPGQPATGLTPSVPAAAHGSPDTYPRSAGNPTASVTAAPGLPPDAAPADGLLARRRIAIARFGTDVAAAGGIGPALAAGLDPADYPVVPAGVPQAWERAQVYLGLCERYQELYQAQLAELHLLMAMAPGCSLPLPHRRPLTGPHTGYISLIRARRGAAIGTTRLSCISAGTRAVAVVQGPHRSVFVADERKRPLGYSLNRSAMGSCSWSSPVLHGRSAGSSRLGGGRTAADGLAPSGCLAGRVLCRGLGRAGGWRLGMPAEDHAAAGRAAPVNADDFRTDPVGGRWASSTDPW